MKTNQVAAAPAAGKEENELKALKEEVVWNGFRRWGYLGADLDPLGRLRPEPHPALEPEGEAAERARRIYCATIGVEFMHIPDPERRRWIQERMEGEPEPIDEEGILDRLIHAELFEQVLQARYVGSKRFSLEGTTALIPLLDAVLDAGADRGLEQAVLAMSHRGRLNVICHTVGRPAPDIFAGFEDVDPRSVLGGGDVKYHLGATGEYEASNGTQVHIHLVSNPSHLEAVDPVAIGRVRAKQTRLGEKAQTRVLPVIMHGDAAFAGQGILAETLNLAGLRGYSVGGTVHVIVNNLIGFTTGFKELHSSRFASDVAKRLAIPILHVNGEDPEAVVRVGHMAAEYRHAFRSDVVVDLIGYRRHGHSEVDDPTITQPLLYQAIEDHPPLWRSYGERVGFDPEALEKVRDKVRAEFEEALDKGRAMERNPVLVKHPAYWANFKGGPYSSSLEVDTGVPLEKLQAIAEVLTRVPEGFSLHGKVARLLEQRAEMGRGKRPVDFAMAEALAFATLLLEGIPVRLSGQDTRRGTFSQRHSVLIDVETEAEYEPLAHLDPDQARFECYNSMLSEAAVMGFEYGFSRDYPEALVLWEAQFGDFANGGQVIIDQFICASEDKWKLLSGLVLLLPHGYEGQGPEHSSARMERFLQLAAEDNCTVSQPSTAAQYFHLLRRQALRKWRKPLIVFTPKSLLRHADAGSSLEEFSRPRILAVLPDKEIEDAGRVLFCTGKICHELRAERKRRQDQKSAIIALEQLYPFPDAELRAEIERHPSAREFVWVQEEPANMGALFYVMPLLERIVGRGMVRSVRRSPSASPATGSSKAHAVEQKTLLAIAFTEKSGA